MTPAPEPLIPEEVMERTREVHREMAWCDNHELQPEPTNCDGCAAIARALIAYGDEEYRRGQRETLEAVREERVTDEARAAELPEEADIDW